MSEPRQARLAEPLLQAPFALGAAVVVYAWDQGAGLAALAVMTVVWPPAVGWRPMRPAGVAAVYVPFAFVWLALTICYLQAMHTFGVAIAPQPMLEQLAQQGLDMPSAGLVIASIVVLWPVVEEVLFRGYLWTAFDRVLPRVWTHVVSSALFGLMHGLEYALPIAVLALVFSWLRARHQSLLAPILAHALHNGLTVALTLLWPGHLDLLYPR